MQVNNDIAAHLDKQLKDVRAEKHQTYKETYVSNESAESEVLELNKKNEDNSVNEKKKWTENTILIAWDFVLNNVEESKCLSIPGS